MANKNPQYYEGILQLRNPNEEVINFIRNQVKKRKGVFIANEVSLKNGVDIYLSSNKFLLSLGRKLKKSFKGELKTSKRLHGQDRLTSKLLYRGTILFKMN